MKGRVLITRPKADAEALAQEIQQKNYDIFCQPLIEIIYHEENLSLSKTQYAGIIFTSKNAVRAFCQNTQDRDLPVLTVGDQTRAEVRAAGFKQVQSAGGGVADLIKLLSHQQAKKPYLYCRGKHISHPLKGAVTAVPIEEVTLYHAEKQQKISDKCVGLIKAGSFSYVLFFSKRTAESFVDFVLTHPDKEVLENGLKSSKALCLGASMIEYVSILPWQEIKLARHPDRKSLLALLD